MLQTGLYRCQMENAERVGGESQEASVRDRILVAANELFYREGMRAVGVDAIVERSGVAKTSLYRWFPSKDALIAAFAAEHDRRYWQWWDEICARHLGAPQAQFHAILRSIAKRIARPEYRGCPALNLATEFSDPEHPGRKVARAHKEELRRRVGVILEAMNVPDPARHAARIALLIDGAYVSGQALSNAIDSEELIAAAEALIAVSTIA
jgi:AcrR family transcriptional regulator